MKYRFLARNTEELDSVAIHLWKLLKTEEERVNLVLFYGEMGAGKTTLIRSMCNVAGVTDIVTSPTFAIINEYEIPTDGRSIFHFDFYRIESLREVYDLGYEEYFFSDNFCFIEWPEKIAPIIDECEESLPMAKITISVADNNAREIILDIVI